jgi:hypothetical protein
VLFNYYFDCFRRRRKLKIEKNFSDFQSKIKIIFVFPGNLFLSTNKLKNNNWHHFRFGPKNNKNELLKTEFWCWY